jgi:uncharacterized protein YdeI (YjbR/CyaY-like superfamily)
MPHGNSKNITMAPIFFNSPAEFRKWLEKNHKTETELVVGYYKVGTGKPSITWSQSVDEALCFGWIDGIRRSVDSESYSIRFTPRRPNSVWSKINIDKVEEMSKRGLMKPMGLEAYEKRKTTKSGIYSYENEVAVLNVDLETMFKANLKAWEFFLKQAPSYKKTATRWIMSARQDITKVNRLKKMIEASEKQKRVF